MQFDLRTTKAMGHGVFRSGPFDQPIRSQAYLGNRLAALTIYLLRVKAIDYEISLRSPGVILFSRKTLPLLSRRVIEEQLPEELGICNELADFYIERHPRTRDIVVDPCRVSQEYLRSAFRGQDISYLVGACNGFNDHYSSQTQTPARTFGEILQNPSFNC